MLDQNRKKNDTSDTELDSPLPGWEELGLDLEEVDYLYSIPYRKYCYYCGKIIYNEPQYICSKCGLSFCEEHRHPEWHNCRGEKKKYVLPPEIGYIELLSMCELCGKVTSVKACPYCGMVFCSEHIAPSNHDCSEYIYHCRIEGGVIIYESGPRMAR
ncbi:hypothetical protein DRP04_13045 [Archaeoglobales archaeon]|nr:MAG: hypothetical protein DRP04_13045 [Archaeoglobales archaeon]